MGPHRGAAGRPGIPGDGPPRVLFTRMTPVDGSCCADCASPRMFLVEDFTAGAWRILRRRRPEPITYRQCGVCGAREQAED